MRRMSGIGWVRSQIELIMLMMLWAAAAYDQVDVGGSSVEQEAHVWQLDW